MLLPGSYSTTTSSSSRLLEIKTRQQSTHFFSSTIPHTVVYHIRRYWTADRQTRPIPGTSISTTAPYQVPGTSTRYYTTPTILVSCVP